MKTEQRTATKKRRIYQVAKEFNISNEALIEFFKERKYKIRNHMTLVTEEMCDVVSSHFIREDIEEEQGSDFRKRLEAKKQVEEARREAIRHEIDEILEQSKGEEFVPVEVIEREVVKPKKPVPKAKPAPVPDKKIEEKKEESKKTEDAPAEEKKKSIKDKTEKPVAADKDDKDKTEKPKRHLKRRPKTEEKHKKFKKTRKPGTPAGEQEASTRKKRRRKRKKSAVKIDEKAITASIKETMAKMTETPKKRRRKKEKELEDIDILEEGVIRTTEYTSVGELANLMEIDSSEIIQTCMSLGLMVTINQRLDRDTILMVADEFGYDVKFLTEYGEERFESLDIDEIDDPDMLEPRPPVVTIMGHVDHGKTSLLDRIRESNIIAGESGGITQHIGAYEVEFSKKMITFLDTPGHEAFTAMRARGAQVTDLVVLVVAADDSVMPQTIEAINHARAANVPMIVAINKIDKPNANPDGIKKQLTEHNVLVEDWGGKQQCAEISAKTGDGIDHLLELIVLESEMLELKANPHSKCRGVLIEAKMDRGKGIVGTVLVQKGTLRVGDIYVAGQYNGRVRAMFNERNHPVEKAPPSTPVQVLGFSGMPQAGDILNVFGTEQEARDVSMKRQQLKREQGFRQMKRLTLDEISRQIAEGEVKELSIIIKADVDGSLEAVSDALMDLGTEDVAVRIILKGVGTITESDVYLAEASQAVIIGFHVSPNPQALELAQREQIDIRQYTVIYDIINDIKLALSGLLEPEITEEVVATIEVREVFKASKVGLIAGCYVQEGKVVRNNLVHLIRDGEVIYEGRIASLKRFKEDVKEVTSGYECGITLEDFKDIQAGDMVEAYLVVETARTLE